MTRFRRTLALILCLALLCPVLPVSAAGSGGRFYLTASTAGQTLIAPVAVSYTAGQTIRDALRSSGYRFTGIDSGFITAIEGVAGNFNVFYDGGAYDLDAPADGVTALLFTELENWSQALLDLTVALGQFNERTDHAQNYPAAKQAYEDALSGLRRADAAAAQQLLAQLNAAIDAYLAELNGEKFTVTLDEQTGTAALFRLTDAYGNVTESTQGSVQVIAGEYRFCVSDGAYNRAEGSLTVRQDLTLTVRLPKGHWFSEVSLRHTRGEGDFAYPAETSGENQMTVYVADLRTSVYLYAKKGADAPSTAVQLYGCYIGLNGTDYADGSIKSNNRSWESYQTTLPSLIAADMQGRQFQLEARCALEDGYTQIQSFAVTLVRVPTLASLTVSGDGTQLPLDFSPEESDYQVTTVSDTLCFAARPFGDTGYHVLYHGGEASELPVEDGTQITVSVRHDNGQSRSYRITVKKEAAVPVSLRVPGGTSAEVRNAAGSKIAPISGDSYRLIPGQTYTYLATKDETSHTTASFTAADGLVVSVAEPETDEQLAAVVMYNGLKPQNSLEYSLSPTFDSAQHHYTLTVPDANSSLYLQATGTNAAYTLAAYYCKQSTVVTTNGTPTRVSLTAQVDPAQNAVRLTQCVAIGGNANALTLRAEKTVGAVQYYQDYTVSIVRRLTLSALTLSEEDAALPLTDAQGAACSFDRDCTEYRVKVARSAREVTLDGAFQSVYNETNPNSGGYRATVNGQSYETLSAISLPLDPERSTEEILVTVLHRDETSCSTTYRIVVEKTDPVRVTFQTTPSDATVFMVNERSGRSVVREADGSFGLTPGDRYTYTVTRNGYIGRTQTGFLAPQTPQTCSVTLEKAAENSSLQPLDAQWPSFRADEYNNGVVSAPTPIQPENAVLYWATPLGNGYSSDACGCPILVGDYLYTYGSEDGKGYLFKVDKHTGRVLASGEMDHKSSFSINSPTYADGMIFVGLANGCVQAFDAGTLRSLWIYRDPLGGQPNCPITYHDGYLYTGFWNKETEDANFVCLSVTDEYPEQEKEEKLASWYYTSRGGFYWAGAYACDQFVLVGTDDGEAGYITGYSRLLSFDPKSGTLLDSVTLPQPGDLRSSVTFQKDAADTAAGSAYFTTKGGYFYRVHVEADGRFTSSSLRALRLYNYADDPVNPAMSTCTPTVYNGRAYVGVSGVSQFGAYSGHNITVIDLATMSIAYTVRTQGYPQTSGILTTHYDTGDGTVYVYFFDNFTPGKLRVLIDRPGQTKAEYTVQEVFNDGGQITSYETPTALFTPDGAQAQYAICSPVVDSDGTIYFKNDSAYLMAVGSTIEKLEVTNPTRTVYHVGERFASEGLQVTAVYQNGTRRDVTEEITFSDEPLTEDDAQFQLIYPNVLYQNVGSAVGVSYHAPIGVVNLTVREHLYEEMETNEQGHRGVCSYCGAVLEEFQPHTFEWVVDREPTETEVGWKHEECFCGYRRSENTEIPRLEHTHRYEETVVEPTCTEQGYTRHTCVCGDSYEDSYVPALGHSFENGACIRCGAADPAGACDGGAACPGHDFADMPGASNWAHKGLDFCIARGLLSGTSDTTVSPNVTMNRAMLVTVLYSLEGKPEVTAENPFTDVENDRWFSKPVIWAAANGIVSGAGNGKFNPFGNVTREQIAVMLRSYARYKNFDTSASVELSPYPDAGSTSGWAKDALSWAVAEGLISGAASGGATYLNPKNNATRAQVATILMQFVTKVIKD